MKTLACPECHSDIFYLAATEQTSSHVDTYCCVNGHVCTLQYKMVKAVPSPSLETGAPVVALDARELDLLGNARLH